MSHQFVQKIAMNTISVLIKLANYVSSVCLNVAIFISSVPTALSCTYVSSLFFYVYVFSQVTIFFQQDLAVSKILKVVHIL